MTEPAYGPPRFGQTLDKPRGVDLEITGESGDLGVFVPTSLRINGDEVLIPSGASVRISDISSEDAVTATVTMFVRSLTIKGSDG